MAEFCKIKADGSVMRASNPLRIVVSNPSDERYRYEGWLEKKYTDRPEYNPDTQYITDHWVQDGKYAVQVWTVHDIPVSDTPEPQISDDEAVAIITDTLTTSEALNIITGGNE